MKKLIVSALIIFASSIQMKAQIMQRLQNAAPEQRRELIKNMSPEERKALIKQFRDNVVAEDLRVEDKNKEEFSKIYNEYLNSQKQIKSGFNTDFDPETLSDQEARAKLDESFVLGEKLIENRRAYAKKFSTVVKPQQVLKMFRNEGMMKDKMMDRRMDLRMREDSARYRESRNDGFRRGNISR